MTLQLYLKDGRWFDKESGLEVSNPEVAFEKKRSGNIWRDNQTKEVVMPGVLYPWEGEWEKVKTCKWDGNQDACGNETCWDLQECQKSPEKWFLRLLPKYPVKEPENLIASQIPYPEGDDYPVIDHPHHTAPTVKTVKNCNLDTNIEYEEECPQCLQHEKTGQQLCDLVAKLEKENKDLREALKGLVNNPSMDLGDMGYHVRDNEGKGWDGPDVIAWGKAVETANKLLEKETK